MANRNGSCKSLALLWQLYDFPHGENLYLTKGKCKLTTSGSANMHESNTNKVSGELYNPVEAQQNRAEYVNGMLKQKSKINVVIAVGLVNCEDVVTGILQDKSLHGNILSIKEESYKYGQPVDGTLEMTKEHSEKFARPVLDPCEIMQTRNHEQFIVEGKVYDQSIDEKYEYSNTHSLTADEEIYNYRQWNLQPVDE